MAEVMLDLLGAQMARVFEELRSLSERLERLEDKVATKEQVAIVWRSLELKLELWFDRQ